MVCPKCGKEVWDNVEANNERAMNGEKLRPDYSCKDKQGCGWLQWRPKQKFQGFQGSPVHQEPKAPAPTPKPANGNTTEMMRLAYRKDLMIALINKAESPVAISDIEYKFQTLWTIIES